MEVEPLADLPCLTQPPPTSYWIAFTQRHITSKRSGKEDANWCVKYRGSKWGAPTTEGGGGDPRDPKSGG